MLDQKLFVSSHAPFIHTGETISSRSYHHMLAALPAVMMGIYQYGTPALGVVAFSLSCAMIWELGINMVMKRPVSIGDGNAAVIGLVFAMLLPATTPWWTVLAGTFVAIVVGKQIFGGMGCNPFNPAVIAAAMLMLSWKSLFDFDQALVNYDLGFYMLYPLKAVEHFGSVAVNNYSIPGLLLGQQAGGIGTTFGLGLITGGAYLLFRGYIRWEISLSFLAALLVTALFFHLSNPDKFAGPLFHLLTGYTLIGAFFLVTEDSSSPVNFFPMLMYGASAGVLTVLIRNIGTFVDGVIFATLIVNIANPMFDKLRPKALGGKAEHA